jgi:hypothetical protein
VNKCGILLPLTNIPVDTTAALVISTGVRHEPVLQPRKHCTHIYCSENPPVTQLLKIPRDPLFVNLTNQKHGKIRIIGYMKSNGTWLAKCDCGNFVIRKTGPWKKWKEKNDCCARCQKENYFKKKG